MSWYAALRTIDSLGQQTARPGSLAALHERRRQHLGQFWTPDALAGYIWRLVSPAMAAAHSKSGGPVALLDNSVGIGRLLQFADPAQHYLAGLDVHRESVDALSQAAREGGFEHHFVCAGMEAVRVTGFNVALINPPYSITLDSALLESYPCTTWGPLGANTRAVSHLYALHQALDAAALVAAVLPASVVDELARDAVLAARLRALLTLPNDTFSAEGANVATVLAVFNTETGAPALRLTVRDLSEAPPALALDCTTRRGRASRIRVLELADEAPTITRAVTGDNRVRIAHRGRRVVLQFGCGLAEAKAMNTLLRGPVARDRLDVHRYPSGVKYDGQGALDLQVHLMQDDPHASFQSLLDDLGALGLVVAVDPGVWGYLTNQLKRIRRASIPLRHIIYPRHGGADMLELPATRPLLLDPARWGGPVVPAGVACRLERLTDGSDAFRVTFNHQPYVVEAATVARHFDLPAEAGWQVRNEGRCHAFPALARAIHSRAARAGVDQWLTWGYQWHDLAEMLVSPTGIINGWRMGLGKTRLALAVALVSGARHVLIETQANLIEEFLLELRGLPIAADEWQVITRPAQTKHLRRINIISRERLRRPVCEVHPKRTYARLLRRRIGLHLLDEGDTLSNIASDQTQAAWAVSARKRFVFTGTPLPNYPRDILPLLAFVAGDGTALQPYGLAWPRRSRPYLEPRLRTSMRYAQRGVDRFRDDFCTFEWVTAEFLDSMQSGAKREVPKINNLAKYRELISRFVLRRVPSEPEVSAHVTIPEPAKAQHVIEWDGAHLAYYLAVAEEFADWYRQYRNGQLRSGKQLNLLTILARIRAVRTAANFPQLGVGRFGRYNALTSKQRAVIDHAVGLVGEGHKVILFAERPELLNLFGRQFEAAGVAPLLYHGGHSIGARFRALNEFRQGDCPLLLASYAVTQRGHNIPQADRALFYEHEWTAKAEDQAGARLLRGQQKAVPLFEWFHLAGSIDDYMGQLVAMKRQCADEGLDWGDVGDDVEFLHLDTILTRFCDELMSLRGQSGGRVRDYFPFVA